ncbi:hypothetical protein [Streptomyces sp. NPDC001880]
MAYAMKLQGCRAALFDDSLYWQQGPAHASVVNVRGAAEGPSPS